jgi:hypothetical protein
MPCSSALERRSIQVMGMRSHRGRRTETPARTVKALLACSALAASVAACGGGGLLDTGKRAPDEFAVYSRAPLSLPPGYNLRPPAPGSTVDDPLGARREARAALVGESAAASSSSAYAGGGSSDYLAPPAGDGSGAAAAAYGDASSRLMVDAGPPVSRGVEALLERSADPAIRELLNRETAVLAEADKSFVERLMFWGTPTEYGTVVDPVEERQRIMENQALGRTITAGTTPTIERKQRALLQGIFD